MFDHSTVSILCCQIYLHCYPVHIRKGHCLLQFCHLVKQHIIIELKTDIRENVLTLFSFFQANIKEVSVDVPHKLHNSIIGAKGRLIRSIMEECGGVIIRFPAEGSSSDKVTIRGPAEDVDKAKKQLIELANQIVSGRLSFSNLYICNYFYLDISVNLNDR